MSRACQYCLEWANRKLATVGAGPATDLATCFADGGPLFWLLACNPMATGTLLAKLVEAMTGKVQHCWPSVLAHYRLGQAVKMNKMVRITQIKLDNIGNWLPVYPGVSVISHYALLPAKCLTTMDKLGVSSVPAHDRLTVGWQVNFSKNISPYDFLKGNVKVRSDA